MCLGAKAVKHQGNSSARERLPLQPQDSTAGGVGESPPAIPDHQLLRLIARGSYGEVWLARNTLESFRAIKIVFEKTFRDQRPFERELAGVQRFEPVSRLHEGLMDVLQVGRNEEAGYFYCVMELADDASSGQVIHPDTYVPHTLAREVAKQKRLPLKSCLHVGITIASALEFLHEHGLIHRDVKPSNIVFINGTPKLVDIGLVAEMSEARSYVGTEGFIPPEGPGTIQSDIYSLGKVLYEISTGKDRYDYPELPTLLDETTHDTQLIGLNRVILRACRSDPRQRYQSAGEMLRDLRALQEGRAVGRTPWEHRRFRLGTRVLSSVAVVVIALIVFGRLRHPGHSHGFADGLSGSIPAPEGLISWWRGEQSAKDSAYGGNHGEVLAGTTYGEGLIGNAFEFDGTNSGVVIPPSRSLAVESFTIEGWVFPRDVSNPRPILEYAGPSGHAYIHLWYGMTAAPGGAFGAPGALYGALRDPDGVALQVGTIRGLVSADRWTHVAFTYDALSRTALLYVNGLMAGSNVSSTPIHPQTLLPINLGFRPDASSELLAGTRHLGLLDEVSIYGRALAPAEVILIYKADAAGKQLASVATRVDGLVSYWRGDGDAKDSVGSNPGTFVNGPSYAPGKIGQSFQLNGSDQFVIVPNSPSLNRTDALTLGAWVFPVELPIPSPGRDGEAIAGKDGIYSNRQYLITLDVRRVFSAHVAVSQKGFQQVYGGTAVVTNQWYHVAMTYDRETLKLYVNGILDASRAWTGPIMISEEPFRIGGGAKEGIPPFHFAGRIDEVILYNRALSEREMQSVYQAGKTGKTLTTR